MHIKTNMSNTFLLIRLENIKKNNDPYCHDTGKYVVSTLWKCKPLETFWKISAAVV